MFHVPIAVLLLVYLLLPTEYCTVPTRPQLPVHGRQGLSAEPQGFAAAEPEAARRRRIE